MANELDNKVAVRSSAVAISLNITTLESLREFCSVLSGTEMVPKAYKGKPDDILVAMLHGQEVGLPHLQALQSIAVVNGVPSIYGDAALALVRASGKLEDFDEWIEVDGKRQDGPFPILKYAEEGRQIVAFCMSKRVGMSRPRITTFSVDDAQRAKLWLKKGQNGFETPWCTVPQRMLMWRARGWNLRDNFGDVLKGLAIYEEAMDLDTVKGPDGKYSAVVDSGPSLDEQKEKLEAAQEALKQQQAQSKTDKPAEANEQPPMTMAMARAALQTNPTPAEIGTIMNWSLSAGLTAEERKEILDLKNLAVDKMSGKKGKR